MLSSMNVLHTHLLNCCCSNNPQITDTQPIQLRTRQPQRLRDWPMLPNSVMNFDQQIRYGTRATSVEEKHVHLATMARANTDVTDAD